MSKPLTLANNRWYAWEMIPGYAGRYYSPILIENVSPLKTGRNILRLSFYNACYAQGVRDFQMDLIVLHRSENFLIAKLDYGKDTDIDRCAIISPITEAWLAEFRPEILACIRDRKIDTSSGVEDALSGVC
jgi:hypothetical protein